MTNKEYCEVKDILNLSVRCIEGLAGQQAMPDDFYDYLLRKICDVVK